MVSLSERVEAFQQRLAAIEAGQPTTEEAQEFLDLFQNRRVLGWKLATRIPEGERYAEFPIFAGPERSDLVEGLKLREETVLRVWEDFGGEPRADLASRLVLGREQLDKIEPALLFDESGGLKVPALENYFEYAWTPSDDYGEKLLLGEIHSREDRWKLVKGITLYNYSKYQIVKEFGEAFTRANMKEMAEKLSQLLV